MLQIVHEWLQKLGNKQQTILSRLSKNAVRNHENVREGGEGGAPASEGSFAANQAHSFQQSIAGYASQNVPGAQTIFNATGFGMNRGRAEYGGGGSDRVREGGAYYLESGGGGNGTSSFAPPPGSPPQIQSTYSYHSPSHEYPLAQASVPMQYGGYSPSYVSPSSPMSAPEPPGRSGFPGFPGSDEPQLVHGFPTPSGPPPGFPGGGGPTYGGHGHNDSGFGPQGIAAGSMFPAPSGDSFGLPEPFNDARAGGGGRFHPPEGPPHGFPSSGQGYGYPPYPPPHGSPGW